MRLPFILLTLSILGVTHISAQDLRPEAKILEGEEAGLREHPWMAAILTASDNDVYQAQFCGGALIDPYWVVTAAHCVDGETARSIDIGLGYHSLDGRQGERFEVAEIIPHPGYFEDSEGNLHNDIALIRLARPADNVSPIALSDSSIDIANGRSVTAYGWGATTSIGRFPRDLQKIEMELISLGSIQRDYDFALRNYHIAARDPFGFGDTCGGDSGGPLVAGSGSSARLVGVVSYGFRCGVTDVPGIYSNVNTLRPWIESAIEGSGLSYVNGSSENLGGGWRSSDWLGTYNDNSYPWIFHDELGWILLSNGDRYSSRELGSEGVWLWDDRLREWLWTSGSAGPWFSDTDGNFRYFLFDGAPTDVFSPRTGWSKR